MDNTGQRGEEMRTIGVWSLTAIERINTVAHLKNATQSQFLSLKIVASHLLAALYDPSNKEDMHAKFSKEDANNIHYD